MKRRNFMRAGVILALSAFSGLTSSKLKAAALAEKVIDAASDFKYRIIALIRELKSEGSNLVKKVMDGRKYEFDPYTHYPYEGGIKDETTGYQLFFHAHREDEFGHFHTFATDEDGELVHLVLISMNEKGELIGLATVNRWVTGDKYVKADVLKNLADNFFIKSSLFKDSRVVDFVNTIFKAYKTEIFELFVERDKWIKNYVNKNYREPFEDREFEILSFKEVNLLEDFISRREK